MDSDKRTQLLRAAVRLFAENGYDGTSLRAISEAAGANLSMISYYFGGKRGLYEEAFASQFRGLTRFLSADTDAMDPRDVIRLYADTALRVHQDNPYLVRYITRELLARDGSASAIHTPLNALYNVLDRAVRRGVAAGLFRADLDVPSAVVLLAGAVNFHYLAQHVRARITADRLDMPGEAAYLSQAVEVFLRGIERRDDA